MRCGKPVQYKEQEYCHDCAHTYHYYDRGAALWLHKEPVSTSIYQFKYHNQRRFGFYYASEMAFRCRNLIRQWNPEAIIPVPLHVHSVCILKAPLVGIGCGLPLLWLSLLSIPGGVTLRNLWDL